jgi:hypothetical protein
MRRRMSDRIGNKAKKGRGPEQGRVNYPAFGRRRRTQMDYSYECRTVSILCALGIQPTRMQDLVNFGGGYS